jgi:alanine racemase
MIDVTDVPDVAVGDTATIYGVAGDQVLSASAVARSIGTVTSDLLCAVTQRVPRVYLS